MERGVEIAGSFLPVALINTIQRASYGVGKQIRCPRFVVRGDVISETSID
jgi:hypothetical protein